VTDLNFVRGKEDLMRNDNGRGDEKELGYQMCAENVTPKIERIFSYGTKRIPSKIKSFDSDFANFCAA
jgi:hypothetical protein